MEKRRQPAQWRGIIIPGMIKPTAASPCLAIFFKSMVHPSVRWKRRLTRKACAKPIMYIIVDPDTKKETENPNFIQPGHIASIAEWVKNGGVLVLMGNDMNNAEFEHFNQLAALFGIRFNTDNYNQVINNQYEQGTLSIHYPAMRSGKARKKYLSKNWQR